jgi:hypothetical protein
MPLECLDMSETAGEEHANLYMRGVNEGASGVELEAQEILDVLEVFGEDGVRMIWSVTWKASKTAQKRTRC